MRHEIPDRPARRRPWLALAFGIALILLLAARSISRYVIEYQWWREVGQVDTWLSMLLYQVAPAMGAALLAFLVLMAAHASALRFAHIRFAGRRIYTAVSTIAALAIAVLLALATIDSWTVVRFFGGRRLPASATAWRDAVFNEPLKFYLFDLPFYSLLLGYVVALVILAMLVYWLVARFWQIRDRFAEFQARQEFDLRVLSLEGGFRSGFLRAAGAVLLLALAVRFYLGRYQMLYDDHGFMVGMNWTAVHWTLPLQYVLIATTLAGAVSVALGRWKWALLILAALLAKAVVPPAVGALYVRPNEMSIERPYIQTHILATRSAFGLDRRIQETEFKAQAEGKFDPARHQAVLSNVRLWDWKAFHDTVTQLQALRTYYKFSDTDIDRYMIDGQLRQVLISPRELDVTALPEAARSGWPNTHVYYTHGYGLVLAEANRITPEGLPVLFIQDIPPVVKTPSLKLARPELYYGQVTHEPVFVHTAQEEFDYPSGEENVKARYQGKGGFPVASFPMRLAAALAEGDPNIVLTTYLTGESRMMIRRDVRERVAALAGFLAWDPDPYLVVTDAGRLVWTIDGYTTSGAHPYSKPISLRGQGAFNYMRNAVKATVDAYDGETHLYVFDEADPIIGAYRRLFPQLFQPASAMPADLRMHARYPEILFRVQAEIYSTFHMQDPQAFYNREDVWDIALTTKSKEGGQQPMDPTYVVASLPGENRAEFLLLIPFTPRNKPNLAGVMMARCDGERLGELVVLQLSKQQQINGPVQVEANINQDQTISKDLSLWDQRGSTVLRGQILVLPVADTLLYVEPIYLQAAQAPMPQLKKVVLMMGTHLIYTDSYEQAIQQLTSIMRGLPAAAPAPGEAPKIEVTAPPSADSRIESIRQHLRRYRDLAAQGRWSEAGKELEAIEAEISRR